MSKYWDPQKDELEPPSTKWLRYYELLNNYISNAKNFSYLVYNNFRILINNVVENYKHKKAEETVQTKVLWENRIILLLF